MALAKSTHNRPTTSSPRAPAGRRSSKSNYHHGNLKQALLEVATEILEERGVAGLSLRFIARRAGVSATAPYHHFAGKKGHLLAAVAAEGFRKMASATRRAPLADAPLDQQLPALCRGYVQFATKNPRLFRLMFGWELSEKDSYQELTSAAGESFGALVGRVEEILTQAGTDGHRADDVAMGVWSLGHGIASLMLDGQISPTVKRLIGDDLVDRTTSLCLGHIVEPSTKSKVSTARRSKAG